MFSWDILSIAFQRTRSPPPPPVQCGWKNAIEVVNDDDDDDDGGNEDDALRRREWNLYRKYTSKTTMDPISMVGKENKITKSIFTRLCSLPLFLYIFEWMFLLSRRLRIADEEEVNKGGGIVIIAIYVYL